MHSALLRSLHSLPLKIPKPLPLPLPLSKRQLHFQARCSSSNSEELEPGTRGMDLFSGLVGERVEELLKREENRALIEGLDEASRRVEKAREELESVRKQRDEALKTREYMLQLESQQAEIEESQKELLEAKIMMEEAQKSLSSTFNAKTIRETSNNLERVESIKAAVISSTVGTLASLPISLSQATDFSELILRSSVVLISCALFGVTFRYAVRRDIDNIQLKTGTAGAFGFVKGLAGFEVANSLELSTDGLISSSVAGAISVAQNVFIFLFAAIALDFCFKMRFLSPFPMRD
ncbi:hypothetical protein LUZ63_009856 [Rhynchospora breviuscula]|uniref:Uncharacterized protein n=1 Tax=Rhynchospora breviuscula TaxID=2022672 RepID=A0A9Q0CFU7_9POAL|nr:hypothetical protein LUZ63_009856 [Rhynchospora breviuscula]